MHLKHDPFYAHSTLGAQPGALGPAHWFDTERAMASTWDALESLQLEIASWLYALLFPGAFCRKMRRLLHPRFLGFCDPRHYPQTVSKCNVFFFFRAVSPRLMVLVLVGSFLAHFYCA